MEKKAHLLEDLISLGGWGGGGVAVNRQNEIAVTDTGSHRIQVFSSNGTHLRSFGTKGVQQGKFAFPVGIAFHNDNVVAVNCRNHRVQLFSDQGEYLCQFGGKGSLDHQLKHPLGLSKSTVMVMLLLPIQVTN